MKGDFKKKLAPEIVKYKEQLSMEKTRFWHNYWRENILRFKSDEICIYDEKNHTMYKVLDDANTTDVNSRNFGVTVAE